MKQRFILVIRADQTVRIGKKPKVMADEIGIPVYLDFPDGWGRLRMDHAITITVPDFTPEIRQETPA